MKKKPLYQLWHITRRWLHPHLAFSLRVCIWRWYWSQVHINPDVPLERYTYFHSHLKWGFIHPLVMCRYRYVRFYFILFLLGIVHFARVCNKNHRRRCSSIRISVFIIASLHRWKFYQTRTNSQYYWYTEIHASVRFISQFEVNR